MFFFYPASYNVSELPNFHTIFFKEDFKFITNIRFFFFNFLFVYFYLIFFFFFFFFFVYVRAYLGINSMKLKQMA